MGAGSHGCLHAKHMNRFQPPATVWTSLSFHKDAVPYDEDVWELYDVTAFSS